MLKRFRSLIVLALVAVLTLLFVAAPSFAGTTYTFKGYNCFITYTLPVPPGMRAMKERVQVGTNIPVAGVVPTIIAMQSLLNSLSTSMSEADPFKGWAPFAGGQECQPQYDVVTTP